jgi:hypothetical protein
MRKRRFGQKVSAELLIDGLNARSGCAYVLSTSALICTRRVSVGNQTVLTDGFRGVAQPLYENTLLVL